MGFQVPSYGPPRVDIGNAPGVPSTAVRYPNSGIGEAVSELGQAAGAAIKHFQDKNDLSEAIKAVSDANLQSEEAFQKDMTTAPAGAANFTPNVLQAYDKATEEIAAKLTSPGAQEKFRNARNAGRDNFGTRALHFEVGEKQRFRGQALSDTADSNGNQLYAADPTSRQSVYDANHQMFEAALEQAELTPDKKQALREEWRNKNSFAGVQADLRDRPDKVQDWLIKGVKVGDHTIDGAGSDFYARLAQAESSGNPTSQATTSTAYGRYQFTVGAWKDTITKHPELGLTEGDRFKDAAQELAVRARVGDLAAILKSHGFENNATNLYMMWFLGPAGGPRFLNALKDYPGMDAKGAVSAEAAAANSGVFNGRSTLQVYQLFTRKFEGPGALIGLKNEAHQSPSDAPSYYADVPIAKRDQYYSQAQTEMDRRRVQGEAAFKQVVQNSLSEYGATGTSTQAPTEQQFTAAMGVPRGTVAYGEFRANADAQAAMYKVQRMPLSEGVQYIETLKPKEGDPFFAEKFRGYTLAKEKAAAVQKQMLEDFGQHVVNINPEAKAALDRAVNSTEPKEVQDAAAQYHTIIDTEGGRLGVPAARRAFLPKAYSEQIAAQLNQKLTSDAQADNIVNTLNGFAARWGENWPKVYSELQTSLSGPVQVITSGIKPQAASILVTVHDKSFDDLTKTIDKTYKRDVDTYLQREFDEFKTSTNWQPSSAAATATFYEQARKLTAVYLTQGTDTKSAAKKAFDDLIGFKYRFADGVRIPKPVEDVGTNLEPALKQEFSNVIRSDAFMPGGYESDVLGTDEAKRRLEGWLERNAKWVTLPDNSGVGLMYQGKLIRDTGGSTVVRTWDQLKGVDVKPERLFGPLHPSTVEREMPFTERQRGVR